MHKADFFDYLKANQIDKTYYFQTNAYLKYCQDNNIDVLSADYATINKYVLHMQSRKCSNAYINVALNAIRYYYKYLLECRSLPINLDNIRKFKLLKVDFKLKNYLTQKEVEEIIRDAMTYIGYMEPLKMRTIILFMFFTGLRIAELTNLKRADINLREMRALIKTPNKNNMERYVYYPQKVAQLLYKYFGYEPEEFNAFNVTQRQIRFLVRKLNDLLPMKKRFTPHTFRHSYTRMLIEHDIGVRIAQKLLGHKSMSSTLVYYNPDDSLVERIYRKNIGEGKLQQPGDFKGDNHDAPGIV